MSYPDTPMGHIHFTEIEHGPSSTPNNKLIKHIVPLEDPFHKFYHLNTQFLPSSKQTTFSANQKGIIRVIRMSPPLEKARFFQNTELEGPSTQAHFRAEQSKDSRTVNTSSKRHPRGKCQDESNLSQCILRLIKGKYLHTREDDVKVVYNNLQSYTEKSKLNMEQIHQLELLAKSDVVPKRLQKAAQRIIKYHWD